MGASVQKLISGGQTGVDRAALDAALARGTACGGWCPRGRIAEDGVIDARYPLVETPKSDYQQRTEWNVRDSDGTLILVRGESGGGTALTGALARQMRKPLLVIDLASADSDPIRVVEWIRRERLGVLNIAGPRESGSPGIYAEVLDFLGRVLDEATA